MTQALTWLGVFIGVALGALMDAIIGGWSIPLLVLLIGYLLYKRNSRG